MQPNQQQKFVGNLPGKTTKPDSHYKWWVILIGMSLFMFGALLSYRGIIAPIIAIIGGVVFGTLTLMQVVGVPSIPLPHWLTHISTHPKRRNLVYFSIIVIGILINVMASIFPYSVLILDDPLTGDTLNWRESSEGHGSCSFFQQGYKVNVQRLPTDRNDYVHYCYEQMKEIGEENFSYQVQIKFLHPGQVQGKAGILFGFADGKGLLFGVYDDGYYQLAIIDTAHSLVDSLTNDKKSAQSSVDALSWTERGFNTVKVEVHGNNVLMLINDKFINSVNIDIPGYTTQGLVGVFTSVADSSKQIQSEALFLDAKIEKL